MEVARRRPRAEMAWGSKMAANPREDENPTSKKFEKFKNFVKIILKNEFGGCGGEWVEEHRGHHPAPRPVNFNFKFFQKFVQFC